MDEGLQMILVGGSRYYEEAVSELGAVPEDGQEGARTDNVVVRPFVYNMEMAYNACDLVLSQSRRHDFSRNNSVRPTIYNRAFASCCWKSLRS